MRRPELAFFALALLCMAAIAFPFVHCGRDSAGGKPADETSVTPLAQVKDDPRSVGEELVRRYLTFQGDHEAWRQGVLELAADPLRSRVASRPADQALLTYGVMVRMTDLEFLGLREDESRAEVLFRASARATPSRPGGEWSVPRETTRKVYLYLVKEGERWLVSEMALQE